MADEAAPQGDPFGSAATAAPPEPESAPEPAAPPAAPAEPASDDGSPDLSEQDQALVAKLAPALGDAVAERIRGSGDEGDAGQLSREDAVARLLGDDQQPEAAHQPPADPNADPNAVYDDGRGGYVDAQGRAVPPEMVVTYDEMGNEVPAAPPPTQGDPRVDQLISYIQGREEREREQELLAIADENPEIREPEMLGTVERYAEQLAREAGNAALATSPTYVRAALALARSERATPPEASADEARNQGATLPTDAGASVDGSPSQEDQWWNGVKGAGGEAFPS